YQVLQERPGAVAVVDAKAMKVTPTYPLGDNGGCNGPALHVKNQILFAPCSANGPARKPREPPQPPPKVAIPWPADRMGIWRLPLAASSDGAAFTPERMEAFSTQGNGTMTIVKEKSPSTFELVQNLKTWPSNGARTIAFDGKTGRLFAMGSEAGPPPPPPPAGTPPAAGGRAGHG